MKIDLKGKRISIIGAGRSGLAAANVVKSLGGLPFVSDSDAGLAPENLNSLSQSGIEFELGEHSDRVYDCDLVVVSPGVPSNSGVVVRARSLGIKVWPEIELAFRLCRGRIIGVTGSNGKTTTTTLIGEMMKKGGREVFVCGNIGNPFVAVAGEVSETGHAVVELSSFQLEMIEDFRCQVAVFLNITPDHLDRHNDLESYVKAKARIFENQESGDLAVINFDDDRLKAISKKLTTRLDWFSVRSRPEHGVYADPDGEFYVHGSAVMASREMKIKGMHNLSNACAAAAAALDTGLEVENIVEVLLSFPGVEHRLEPVRLIGGVSFINDSKGTNVDSVHWALLAISAPIILIAGGKDKGGDFSSLNSLIGERVKRVVLIGQAAGKIKETWGGIVECEIVAGMQDAVRVAFAAADSGDTVLLSPGCASFDMFDNYEHRGKVFKDAVEKIASGKVVS